MSDHDNGTSTALDILPASTLGALVQAEIDTQIATAKRYPRSLSRFKKDALAMACLDEETAASCFYSVPRGGKHVSGPSVRLAEICAIAWGNLRHGARVIADDGRMITAQGLCIDLEKNVANTIEVKRRVTDKHGRRFSDDMVIVTCNAACAIALRNAVFKVVPLSFVRDIEREARKVAIGDAKTLASKRTDMMAYFAKMGLSDARVLATVGKASVEDVGLDELTTLKGLATAIKDGEVTVDAAFPAQKPSEQTVPAGSKADALANRLGAPKEAAVDTAQRAKLEDAIREQGLDLDAFLDHFGVKALAQLPEGKYAEALAWLEGAGAEAQS